MEVASDGYHSRSVVVASAETNVRRAHLHTKRINGVDLDSPFGINFLHP